MKSLVSLVCRCVIAVCAEIIHHVSPDDEVEDFGPRIYWSDAAVGQP